MKHLNQIQTLSKIGKILSKIAFICSVLGFCGCIAGLLTLAFGGGAILEWGGVTLHGIVDYREPYSIEGLSAVLAAWLILCAGEAILSWFAQRYFAHELAQCTPFTQSGANELRRLGFLTIFIPLGCAVIADITQGIIAGFLNITTDAITDICFDQGTSIILGIMFLILSLLCNYGAALSEPQQIK